MIFHNTNAMASVPEREREGFGISCSYKWLNAMNNARQRSRNNALLYIRRNALASQQKAYCSLSDNRECGLAVFVPLTSEPFVFEIQNCTTK